MGRSTINAELCAKMFLAGAQNLEAHKEWINELNVFPVPDGDTGTNMSLTIMSAAKEVAALDEIRMDVVAKAISSGSLRGARGNSGVILSQLLRGFTKVIKDKEEIDVITITEAFQKATATAYKAVMKPKEGTILTVAKGFSDKAAELALTENIDMEELLRQSLSYAEEVLLKTPDMLPVLKEAGVVDSGGQGLIQVMKGAFDAYLGKEIDYAAMAEEQNAAKGPELKNLYYAEFVITARKEISEDEKEKIAAVLENISESVISFGDRTLEIYVHTNDPGVVISKSMKFGELSAVKIVNMREEGLCDLPVIEEAAAEPEMPHKDFGFIAVSIGEGIGEIFKGLGVDHLIEGGQTMNPSTEDMLKAIDKVNADTIYIFPNNKNIILAANQAQALTEDKKIVVIPTKTVPQGIAALISFDPEGDAESNTEAMEEAISLIKTGQVTYAVRDTSIDGKEIHEGNIMGIGDSSILSVGNDIAETTKEMLSLMEADEAELISVYYGEEVTQEDAEKLGAELQELYPDCEVEVYSGGQPIYYYVVSVE